MRSGHRVQKFQIEPFVQHAKKAEPGPGNRLLAVRFGKNTAGTAEVLLVDAAREAVDVRMPVVFGTVQTRSSGKNQVGHLQQRGLALNHLAGRISERG